MSPNAKPVLVNSQGKQSARVSQQVSLVDPTKSASANTETSNLAQVPLYMQKHFTIQELDHWGVNRVTLTEWFRDEPDVLKVGYGYRRGRNGRVTLRIPESVVARVYYKKLQGDRR